MGWLEWFFPVLICWSVVDVSTQDASPIHSGTLLIRNKFTGVIKYTHEIRDEDLNSENITVAEVPNLSDVMIISIGSDMGSREKIEIRHKDKAGQFWRITIDRSDDIVTPTPGTPNTTSSISTPLTTPTRIGTTPTPSSTTSSTETPPTPSSTTSSTETTPTPPPTKSTMKETPPPTPPTSTPTETTPTPSSTTSSTETPPDTTSTSSTETTPTPSSTSSTETTPTPSSTKSTTTETTPTPTSTEPSTSPEPTNSTSSTETTSSTGKTPTRTGTTLSVTLTPPTPIPTTTSPPYTHQHLYLRKFDMMFATVMDPSGKCWNLYVQAVKQPPSAFPEVEYQERDPTRLTIALKEGYTRYPVKDNKDLKWRIDINVTEARNVTLPLVFGEDNKIVVLAYFGKSFGHNRTDEMYMPRVLPGSQEDVVPVLVLPKEPNDSVLEAVDGMTSATIGSKSEIALIGPDKARWTAVVQIVKINTLKGSPLKVNISRINLSLRYDRSVTSVVKDSSGVFYSIKIDLKKGFAQGLKSQTLSNDEFILLLDFNLVAQVNESH